MIILREAGAADAPAIAAIYAALIADTTITFRSAPTSTEDRAAWIAERQASGFPVMVSERDGDVLGYASYGPFRGLDGYRLTVEHTIALSPAARGQGLGRELMQALIARARSDGLHVMVGALSSDNAASRRMHAALGFTLAGTLPQTGQKFGRWLNLELWQLLLDGRERP
ncbi:GNAT family N-acetyltransferase [Paracoccus suum]|nr:GNAT family N-acetyltransferase [Paracoccus suum]